MIQRKIRKAFYSLERSLLTLDEPEIAIANLKFVIDYCEDAIDMLRDEY